ncbi:MAG: polymerase subunit alpha [Panacagrimonas sp.]|nr:DNA polymerase III subunit alpha [Panacagrimonas sp.]MCC2657839.1 polymerase subunit alpha [Panacagrimonas sp.]
MFVHLRLHTEFSLTDGLIRVEPPKRKGVEGATLASQVARLGMPAVGLTDRMNVFAMVKFYKSCEGAGIKPIVGCDLWLAEAQKGESPERLTLLVQNQTGYRNLTRLISRGYTDGQAKGTPLIEREWLREAADGLIALSGRDGSAYRAAIQHNAKAALAAVDELSTLFPNRLYLEVSRCGRPGDDEWVEAATALARRCRVPLVATNDVRFLERKDFEAHEARVCIAQGRVLADDKRPRDYTDEQYLKSADEMRTLFADLPEAIENTLEIARRCTLTLKFGTYHLPNYPVPEDHTTDTWLRDEAHRGLTERLKQIQIAQPESVYRERLDYELGIIQKMGFAGYFLVVSDFIRWAKSNGCPVGPGRGSGAGSLVAYSVGITDLDPLPYNLLFEIEYVSQKYGRERVGQIITYSTMAARGVVRDVCRIMGHGYGFGDRIAKLIPGLPGTTLSDSVEEVPELKKAYAEEEDTRAVLDLALELEGLTRGVGVHAGGVVIAPQPLTEYAPLLCEPGGAGLRSQFDMKDIESIGLVKFDFLGLKTLTIIQKAIETIARSRGEHVDVLGLPLNDGKTYELYASGDTSAVFQMESPGMQRASRDLKPDTFEDIIALVSLYRPGPMELIPEYCARKRGDADVTYLHPDMESVLSPTYGIFVYQEQVMQMSQRLAGYTLGGADLLRRAMGKKNAKEMAQQREVFTKGSLDKGIAEDTAAAVFDLMEKFANYGFNKSHAAAYALVSYQTAWLKTHYPAEFMAAVMSCDMDHTETVVAMLAECRRMKLKVHPPDINRSHFQFTVPGSGEIAYGLGAIKGVGEAALAGIVADRAAQGPFRDLFDFCLRIDLKKVNKRVLEALIYSGAMDAFGLNRASLLRNLPKALAMAEAASRSADTGQEDMFGMAAPGPSGTGGNSPRIDPEVVPELPQRERLEFERQTLGFYLSGHPIEAYAPIIDAVCSGRLRDVLAAQSQSAPALASDGKPVWQPRTKAMFAAWVTDVRFFRGRPDADGRASRASYKVTLDDRGAQVSSWVDIDVFQRVQDLLKPDRLVFVTAEIGTSAGREGREPEARLYVPEFLGLDGVLAQYLTRVELAWGDTGVAEVLRLRRLLEPLRSASGTSVSVTVERACGRAVLDFGTDWRVRFTEAALQGLRQMLGAEHAKLDFRRFVPPQTERRPARATFGNPYDDE